MTQDRRPMGPVLGVAITLAVLAVFAAGFYGGMKYAGRKALHTQILLPWELEPWDQVQLSTALLINAVQDGGAEIAIKDQYTAEELLDEQVADITTPSPAPTEGGQ